MNVSQNMQSEKKAKRGRPIGSTVFDRDSFLNHAVEVYARFICDGFKRPTQYDVGEKLGIVRHTIMRYLKREGMTWNQIHDLAMRANCEKECA